MANLQGAIGAVQPGQNGRLFLGQQDGFHLDLFVSGQTYNAPLLERWRRTLARRSAELGQRGIPYVFFIVPDAPSVHPDDLPPALQREFRPPGEQFLDAMGDIPGVHFVYPLAKLRQNRGGLAMYQKKDSHWTSYGSYTAYRALMDKVATLVPCTTVQARDVSYTFRRSYGDLGSLTEPEQAEDVPVVQINGPELDRVVGYDGALRQTATESRASNAAQCRAIFFRDSFMTDLAPYIARSFSDVVTLGTTTRVMLDAVDSWKANLVVSQVAERKIFFWQSDHQLDTHDTIYRTGFRTGAGVRLLRALNMVGENPAAALALLADDADELMADPENAYSMALIHEAAGDIAMAHELAQRALAAQPGHPSFLGLTARTSMATGKLEMAVGLAERAVGAAPYNGYFYEMQAYCLVLSQKPAAALKVIEAGLHRIKDSPNLWYWAAVCQREVGDFGSAVQSAREAVSMASDNGEYLQLLAWLEDRVGTAQAA